MHKKGKLHTNADALSRPVINYVRVEDDEEGSKNLDPYDDDTLIFYLKYKKHLDGNSKKRVKRIEKEQENFKWKIDDLGKEEI